MKKIPKETWAQTIEYKLNKSLEFTNVLPLDNLSGKKVLDFGCGSGRDTVSLAKNEVDAYGVDILKSNIQNAKKLSKNNKTKAHFKLVKENQDIPYKNNFFDCIICSGVLHHIKHANEVIDEFKRVLKPNGILYLMVYTEDLFKMNIDKIINMIKNTPEKTWQRCFGEITDKCEYSTFYTFYDAVVLFESKLFRHLISIPFHNFQFRIFKFKNIKEVK